MDGSFLNISNSIRSAGSSQEAEEELIDEMDKLEMHRINDRYTCSHTETTRIIELLKNWIPVECAFALLLHSVQKGDTFA